MKKQIIQIIKTVLLLSSLLLLAACGGGGDGAEQDPDHAAIAKLFERQLNRVIDRRHGSRNHNIELVRAWTKRSGYAVYYDNNSREYVAVNLRYYIVDAEKLVKSLK